MLLQIIYKILFNTYLSYRANIISGKRLQYSYAWLSCGIEDTFMSEAKETEPLL